MLKRYIRTLWALLQCKDFLNNAIQKINSRKPWYGETAMQIQNKQWTQLPAIAPKAAAEYTILELIAIGKFKTITNMLLDL